MSLTDDAKDYSSYINKVLSKYGNSENELLIFITTDPVQSTTLYYNPNSNIQVKSEKMTCLIKTQILQKYPDMDITEKPYQDSFDNNMIFVNNKNYQNNPYNYWIIIQVKKDSLSNADLADSITTAIDQYYN